MSKYHIYRDEYLGYALFDDSRKGWTQQISKWYTRKGYLLHIMHSQMFPHLSYTQFQEFVKEIDDSDKTI